MRILFILGWIWLCCCESRNKEVILPAPFEAEPQWMTYEGTIPTQSGEEITVELSLKAGSPGFDAEYKLLEWRAASNTYVMGRSSFGYYSAMAGAGSDEFIIQLHDCYINRMLMSDQMTEDQVKQMRHQYKQTTEIYFKTKDNKLILLDKNFNEVNADKYSLIRRSKSFTVEGYITFVNDTSEFFEMNTRENWALSERGMYPQARLKYQALATEKFEGIYVRGLAYSVEHNSATGETIDALVLRNIYEMRPGNPINP